MTPGISSSKAGLPQMFVFDGLKGALSGNNNSPHSLQQIHKFLSRLQKFRRA